MLQALSLQNPGHAESGVILYYESGESHLDVVHLSAVHDATCIVSMLTISVQVWQMPSGCAEALIVKYMETCLVIKDSSASNRVWISL